MQAYRVKQWDKEHETAESRKYKSLSWCAMPLKHDGLGFRHTVRQSEKNDLLAGWYMLLQVAGKGPREIRGWLVRDGKPLTAADLSLMTGLSETTFTKALEFFSKPPADWLELAEFPGTPATPPASPEAYPGTPATPPASRLIHNSTLQNKTNSSKERERSGATVSEVQASRTQAGALLAQIKVLEARKSELNPAERAELRKKRAALERLQKKQANGDFSPERETAEASSKRSEYLPGS